jgi:sec-independent protein translocase protein TatC
VAAVVTPSVDPVTMLVTMVPLIVLYELSILLSTLVGSRKDDTDEPEADADELEAAAAPPHLPPEED